MSTLDLQKLLMVIQLIKGKGGKCASKMEVVIMMIEDLDVFFGI